MLQPIKSDQPSTNTNSEDLNKLELEANSNTALIQNYQDPEEKTAEILDDATLIEKFVQGETQLLANQSLRLDSSFDRIELTTRKGIIIGLYTLNSQTISVLIRSGSEYNELLYESLLKNNFILIGKSPQKGFVEYQQYIPPTGYKINFTPTVVLWRNWWMGERKAHKHQIQIDILIYFKNKWYPILEISSHQEVFHIKTLMGELTLHQGESIIWVSKLPGNSNPTDELNIVQAIADLDIDPNNLYKFNIQQAASTEIQASAPQIQSLSQNNHQLKPASLYLEQSGFNSKQTDQGIKFTTFASNQPNLEAANSNKEENIAIRNSNEQPKTQNFEDLDQSPVEETLQSLKIKAVKALENYIINGATEIITEEVRNAQGQTIKTKSVTIKNKCPNRVIDRVLKKNDLLQKNSWNSKKSQENQENSEAGYLDLPL